ncbi:hypothetical protein HYW18_01405 [Candidatus Uhrbacteria bacterium]|nr:hypothetical protein [Candidatus Uhrbacteria bacterium]
MQDFLSASQETRQTEKFLTRAAWWVEHKERARRLGVILWAVAAGALLFFALWVFADAFFFRYETERALVRGLAIENPNDLRENAQVFAAKPIRPLSEPLVLSAKEGFVDLLSFVENPNDRWWARVEYQYVSGETPLGEPQFVNIYPKEQAALLALAVPHDRTLSRPTLRTRQVTWHAIDPHTIPDVSAWMAERALFQITDASFLPAVFSGDVPVGRSLFTIKNAGAYGYWEVPAVVLLRRGEAIVGATHTVFENLEAGESRTVELSWFGTYPSVTRVDVLPRPDLFTPSAYLPPSLSSNP